MRCRIGGGKELHVQKLGQYLHLPCTECMPGKDSVKMLLLATLSETTRMCSSVLRGDNEVHIQMLVQYFHRLSLQLPSNYQVCGSVDSWE